MGQFSNEEDVLLFRYLDNDMTVEERSEFEELVKENKGLQEELESEKRLFQLGKSTTEEIRKYEDEKKIEDTEPNAMTKQAIESWKNHENVLGQEHRIPAGEVKNIPNNEKPIKEMNSELIRVEEKRNVQPSGKEEEKVKRMFLYKWVAAAVVIGFVSLGVIFWYFRNENNDRSIAINKNQPNSENKNEDSQKNGFNTDTSSSQVNNSRSDSTLSNRKSLKNGIEKAERERLVARNFEQKKIPAHAPTSSPPINDSGSNAMLSNSNPNKDRVKIEQTEGERLLVKNFEADSLPSHIPEPLEDPSAYYKDNKLEDAIEGYKKVLAEIKDAENSDVISIGNRKIELTSFYAHYYIAQCYMSINNTANAIQEFENAITKAPDEIWKSKAQWYLALAYLKTGQIQKAETLLERVGTNEQANEYKQKAIKLIEELKKK